MVDTKSTQNSPGVAPIVPTTTINLDLRGTTLPANKRDAAGCSEAELSSPRNADPDRVAKLAHLMKEAGQLNRLDEHIQRYESGVDRTLRPLQMEVFRAVCDGLKQGLKQLRRGVEIQISIRRNRISSRASSRYCATPSC